MTRKTEVILWRTASELFVSSISNNKNNTHKSYMFFSYIKFFKKGVTIYTDIFI